ncbi:hypothetical protein L596_001576 [Steinernema carpocapsae]|uniref:Uncharacterized protein n=1 Tax=Steinernema carpocapsae TaxID=34508 RepID=A0A4U8UP82_STECR|nr:hypothetical protein L596_001576 [Steinernema carpocapsae]
MWLPMLLLLYLTLIDLSEGSKKVEHEATDDDADAADEDKINVLSRQITELWRITLNETSSNSEKKDADAKMKDKFAEIEKIKARKEARKNKTKTAETVKFADTKSATSTTPVATPGAKLNITTSFTMPTQNPTVPTSAGNTTAKAMTPKSTASTSISFAAGALILWMLAK